MPKLFQLSFCTVCCLLASTCAAQSNVAKRSELLLRLSELSSTENADWLVGQNIGHGDGDLNRGYQDYFRSVERRFGRVPALLGFDLGYQSIPRSQRAALRISSAHASRGGLITISMHPPNPFRSSDAHDVSDVGNWSQLNRGGSFASLRWDRTLARAADCIEALGDRGIVVMWRPLHEMNGGWFWWGGKDNDGNWVPKSDFVSLWRHMHDYMTHERKLDNIVWVYSAAVQTHDGMKPADYYYPGDEYVDVVGLDWYDDNLQNLDAFASYSQLARLNKPMGLTEFGPSQQRDGTFDNRLLLSALAEYRRIGFVLYWHSWAGNKVAMSDQKNIDALRAGLFAGE